MAEDNSRKRGYPYMSINVWAEIRRSFAKNLPSRVTSTYLQTVLKSSAKTAGNILPQLRTLGLIDTEGAPLDVAKRFRLDGEYQGAVAEIVDRLYPSELRDLFPGPEEDLKDVANWFMLHTAGGQIGSTAQARFYLMLVSGELPTADSRKSHNAGPGDTKPTAQKRQMRNAPATTPASAPVSTTPAAPAANSTTSSRPLMPGLSLDIQIHIDAEATLEQIDAVFASMARHLYNSE